MELEHTVTTKRIKEESIIEFILGRYYMKKAGFVVDRKRDVYVKPGFGAWVTNVSSYVNMESIKHIGGFEYTQREGCEYVLGPGAPSKNGKVECMGLYLKNYKEVYDRQGKDSEAKPYVKT